jgi:aryl-alcohol dehydrogenase-like predicted oxidoreductase
MQQLKENIAAFKQPLPIEAIDEIKQVLQQYPMPY